VWLVRKQLLRIEKGNNETEVNKSETESGNSEKESSNIDLEVSYSVVGEDTNHQETIGDIKVLIYYN